MDLTPEERERIYQEEKARRDAREMLKDEEAGASGYNPDDKWGVIILGIGALVFVLLGSVYLSTRSGQGGSPAAPAPQHQPQLASDALVVTVVEQEMVSEEYQKWMVCKIKMENRSQRDVRGFNGSLVFTDLFDKEIIRLTFQEEDVLKAGDSRLAKRFWKYNQFIDEHVRWATTKQENTKVTWLVDDILWATNDGAE